MEVTKTFLQFINLVIDTVCLASRGQVLDEVAGACLDYTDILG